MSRSRRGWRGSARAEGRRDIDVASPPSPSDSGVPSLLSWRVGGRPGVGRWRTMALMAEVSPAAWRARFRACLRVPTASWAPGFAQANLVVVPQDAAAEFELF